MTNRFPTHRHMDRRWYVRRHLIRLLGMALCSRTPFASRPDAVLARGVIDADNIPGRSSKPALHAGSFPARFETFPEVLGKNGYWVGFTGKGWGPGNYKVDGRESNPTGPEFQAPKPAQGTTMLRVSRSSSRSDRRGSRFVFGSAAMILIGRIARAPERKAGWILQR